MFLFQTIECLVMLNHQQVIFTFLWVYQCSITMDFVNKNISYLDRLLWLFDLDRLLDPDLLDDPDEILLFRPLVLASLPLSFPLAILSLLSSLSDSLVEIVALDTILLFCLALRPSSTSFLASLPFPFFRLLCGAPPSVSSESMPLRSLLLRPPPLRLPWKRKFNILHLFLINSNCVNYLFFLKSYSNPLPIIVSHSKCSHWHINQQKNIF